jgi:hypothetical protein
VVGNEELEQRFGVDEGWIESKTGIGARRVVAPEQSSAELATNAAAPRSPAPTSPTDIDLIVSRRARRRSWRPTRPPSSPTGSASIAARSTSTPPARDSYTAWS